MAGYRHDLRVSDAERERTADALRRHHVDGRLDTDELQERLGRAYAARTAGELEAVMRDLPAEASGAAAGRGPAAPPAAGLGTVVLVALLALCVAGAAAVAHHAGHPGPFAIFAVLLAFRLLRGPGRRAAWGPRG
jgi:uncharacterized protein DUF1707